MKANSAPLGSFREGTVMNAWPAASSVAEQHESDKILPAEEGKQEKQVTGKRMSAILGYELDDWSIGITYYSQDRWKHVSDNFLHVRPEDEVETTPGHGSAWIFSYSTDFETRGINWRNDRNEIMLNLRRYPPKFPGDRNRLVMNSCTDPLRLFKTSSRMTEVWGNEEYVSFSPEDVSFSPADVGNGIHMRQIAVFLDHAGFHVVWDGKVKYTFKHRIPWSSFRNLQVDPSVNANSGKMEEMKDTTLQRMLLKMGITAAGIFQELEKVSNSLFDKEVRGSGRFRVATWDGEERKFLTVQQDTHQSRVKVGNIKEFISIVLEVPELTKQEFDKWYKLRVISGTQWKTILPVIFSNSKEKRSLFTVAKQNCEALLCMQEEKVLLELVLENSMPLLVSVVFSGAICQFARESHSRDHRRASRADVLAAVFERLACSIVDRVQLMQPVGDACDTGWGEAAEEGPRGEGGGAGGEKLKDKRQKEMDECNEVLEFATIHRMKGFISEPVIVSRVNNRWSDTNLVAGVEKWIPGFLNPSNLTSNSKNNFFLWYLVIIMSSIYVIVCAFPLFLLTSSWPPAWRFWAFQASYLTYIVLAIFLPKLCPDPWGPKKWSRNACMEFGQPDVDCCGALCNLI
jgi:hypothetical protein